MKNIKCFKYVNENNFNVFLNEYGYTLNDVIGFKFIDKKQYRCNVLTTYAIYFKDDEYEYFKVAVFESFNEYRQSALDFNGNKLLEWWENANIRMYK